jgi:hypothetical protein
MRASTLLIAATALASSLLVSAAEARISLNQCRSNEVACHRACLISINGSTASSDTLYRLKQCLNGCDANHAACVDFAMSNAMLSSDGGPAKPPKNFGVLNGGLLSNDPGFATQAPSAIGTPIVTPPRAPTGGGVIN